MWSFDEIISFVASVPVFKARNDDDFAARLNHRFTVAVLTSFLFVNELQTFVGEYRIKIFKLKNIGVLNYTGHYIYCNSQQ